jgi:hypothetical protein
MQEKNITTLWIIVGLVVLAVLGYAVYHKQKAPEQATFITNYDDCVKAGYTVSDTYPRECTTPAGDVYKEVLVGGDAGENTATATGGCYIGGCSQQICSDQPDAVSDCAYRPEYSCYQSGQCGRQADGKCGWTQTTALTSCLELKLGNLSK